MGMKTMVTLKDIAEICHVSISTVSKALNDREDIGEDKKKEIQRVAKELNYIPNYMAASLRSKKTKNIGVLLSEATGTNLMHEHFARILNSFKDTVEARGYFLTFLNASTSKSRRSYIEQCKYLNFDGVLIVCADYRLYEVRELIASDMVLATIDYTTRKHINVRSNFEGDMNRLMQFIYAKGHRRIAYMHGEDSEVTRARVDVYRDFMRRHNRQLPADYQVTCPYRDYEQASALTRSLMSQKNRPTCIIYPDDLTAVGGLNTLQQMGIRVPEDVSIAGYDGINMVNIVRPRITTIRQDTVSMGIQAGMRLINRIEFPRAKPQAETIIVDGMVEPGESVSVISTMR